MVLIKRGLIVFLAFILISCYSQNEKRFKCNDGFHVVNNEYDYQKINKEWLSEDVVFYNKLKDICLKSPHDIEELILVNDVEKIILGNGYYSKRGSFGVGYITIYYEFVYKHDQLIAYKLDLPLKDILLLEKEKLNPKEIFKLTVSAFNNTEDYLFYFGFEKVCLPNKNIKLKNINPNIKFYMSPFSGVIYGCRGGYGNAILPNRCAFRKLLNEQNMTYEVIIYIMHSINLASRLTAIEYYTRNINEFNKQEQIVIEELAKDIFLSFGKEKIKVLDGDIGYYIEIEEAINKQLKKKCE